MVKDEADVIADVVEHMADEVDRLLVADNGSTDGTRAILDGLARRLPLTVVDDPDPAYYQSAKMTALAAGIAAAAHTSGEPAPWIVPFDADEVWLAPQRIGDLLTEWGADGDGPYVAHARLFNHFCTALDGPEDLGPIRSMVWRQQAPAPLTKVVFQWVDGALIHQGNHGVSIPDAAGMVHLAEVGLQVRHFPYRSAEQFVRKARNGAAAYAATDLPADAGAHWRGYGQLMQRLGEHSLREVFAQHFWYLSPVDAGLVHDPAPLRRWQPS